MDIWRFYEAFWGTGVWEILVNTTLSQVLITDPYFDFQAALGMSKHPGGLSSTKELAELCGITRPSYVLDVGCGVGATACWLARSIGCRVVGIDISEEMIARAKERAKREGVEDKVEFRRADALKLPFKSNSFDVVIGESVLMFIKNRKKAIREYRRVVKKGGE